MTVPADTPTTPDEPGCALCGAPLRGHLERCAECGYAQPRPFSRAAVAAFCAVLVAVYVVTLVVVALAR